MLRARLIARHGPLAGLEVVLPDEAAVMGRGSSCAVVLDDGSVSREHCVIEELAGGLMVRDLGSKNGTSLNGIPVDAAPLASGDLLRIGRSTFEVQWDTGPAPVAMPAAGEAGGAGAPEHATVTLAWRADDGAAETTAQQAVGDDAPGRPAAALMHLAEALAGAGGPADLLGRVCETTTDALPVSRAAAVLFSDATSPERSAARGRGGTVLSSLELPPALCARVRERGESVLTPDLALDPAAAPSGAASLFCTAIAAPLRAGGRTVGLLYADTAGANEADGLGASDLAWLRAAGALAGPTLAATALLQAGEARHHRGPAPAELVGRSAPMRTIFEMLRKVAPTPSTVLITGESGTGKELIARALHQNSPRRRGPLVAVNCAALPRELVESELFGHERGAFTGAVARRPGRFEQATGGTLFLDEIGDLPADAQAKILRALEERCVTRVGGTTETPVDVRIIAAVEIAVPPLRERGDDIPYLAALFLERLREECGHQLEGFDPDTLTLLGGYAWPGNVRELRNAVERATVFAAGPRLTPADFHFLDRSGAPAGSPEDLPTLRDLERRHVLRVLEATGGNKSRAARVLGIERSTLYEKLRSYGV
ncbi:MAG: sigma 54-interacting transcriptional regulator [Planctomycetota bacterium]|jgi:transcriptional regulator with GAF, ATPase, and Fis domain